MAHVYECRDTYYEGKVEGATQYHIKLLTSKKALRTKIFLHIGPRMKALAEKRTKLPYLSSVHFFCPQFHRPKISSLLLVLPEAYPTKTT